jgi:lysophospholipase L1-like esterase
MIKKERLVFFGDSMTEGSYGVTYVDELRKYGGADGFEMINAGKAGNTSWNLLARIDRDVLDKNPKVVVVEIGGNDFLTVHSPLHGLIRGWGRVQKKCPISPEIFFENYHKILDKLATQPEIRVLCVVTPTLGENPFTSIEKLFSSYMDAIRQAANDRGLVLVDFNEPFFECLRKEGGYQEFSLLRCMYSYMMIRFLRRDPEKVAASQGLKLTFDTLHPNRRGARLLAQTLAPELPIENML